jgi:hypothetical protein
MRSLRALFLFSLGLLSCGCALVEDSGRNIGLCFTRSREARQEWRRNYRWADRAWAETCAAHGGSAPSKDYETGFKDGFAEYLYRGGNGEPPLVAPLRYRRLCYQSPQGYRAIDDWFAGYRHGSTVAKASGAREWITGPSSLHPWGGSAKPPGPPVSPELDPGNPEKAPAPDLPSPRPLPETQRPKQTAPSTQPSPPLESPDKASELPAEEPEP